VVSRLPQKGFPLIPLNLLLSLSVLLAQSACAACFNVFSLSFKFFADQIFTSVFILISQKSLRTESLKLILMSFINVSTANIHSIRA